MIIALTWALCPGEDPTRTSRTLVCHCKDGEESELCDSPRWSTTVEGESVLDNEVNRISWRSSRQFRHCLIWPVRRSFRAEIATVECREPPQTHQRLCDRSVVGWGGDGLFGSVVEHTVLPVVPQDPDHPGMRAQGQGKGVSLTGP